MAEDIQIINQEKIQLESRLKQIKDELKVKLYGKGKCNQMDVIREVELNASEMKEIFGIVDKSVNESVAYETEKIIEKETVKITIEHHAPKKIKPVENNTIKDLKK
ncbi:hypothetical protein ACJJTC_011826 [Scirpophaga incertulas]